MTELVVKQENNSNQMFSLIEKIALDPNADVSKLEKLIEP